jgi:hypothetical protein
MCESCGDTVRVMHISDVDSGCRQGLDAENELTINNDLES